jgi:hypothetical protein
MKRCIIRTYVRWVALAVLLANSLALVDLATGQEPSEKHAELKRKMMARWKESRAFLWKGDEKAELDRVAEPVFSFIETARENGHHLGTVWVWGSDGRPLALMAQGRDLDHPLSGYELIALSDDVSAVMHDGWEWRPRKSALILKQFSDSPAMGGTEAARLIQMRALARRFEVSESFNSETHQLRLLPQPFYRYKDTAKGLIDGAFFNFAHGTNPEALLVIECHQRPAAATWSYGFVPLAGAEVTARLNGESVWTKRSTMGSRLQEPYSTWLESGSD